MRVPHLLETGGGIPQLVKKIKVLDSREMSLEEFLNDIFRSKS